MSQSRINTKKNSSIMPERVIENVFVIKNSILIWGIWNSRKTSRCRHRSGSNTERNRGKVRC
jgi:hypothetical protein